MRQQYTTALYHNATSKQISRIHNFFSIKTGKECIEVKLQSQRFRN